MSDPVFKSIFGAAWDGMPRVFRRHYANRPYSDDIATVEGVMDISCAGPVKWLAPLFALARTIPPYEEKGVKVTVHFRSHPRTGFFYFERIFHFKGRKPYRFRSTMIPVGGNEIVEATGPGAGWRCAFGSAGDRIIMRHKGFAAHVMGRTFPVPLAWLLGEGHAEEIAVDDDTFDMFMHLTHPRFGKIYEYKGRFRMVRDV